MSSLPVFVVTKFLTAGAEKKRGGEDGGVTGRNSTPRFVVTNVLKRDELFLSWGRAYMPLP